MSCLHATIVLLLTMTLVAVTGCRSEPETEPRVLLQVNSRIVTLEEFERQFDRTLPAEHALSPDSIDELRRSFLRQVIDRELVLAEAQRLGISLHAQSVEDALSEYRRDYPAGGFEEMLAEQGFSPEQWRQELAARLLMEKTIDQAVYSLVTVSEDQIEEFYRENREQFNRPEQVRARQILVSDEQAGRAALERLQAGEPFAKVAQQVSLSPDAAQGGDLGFFPAGEMPPEFDAVVFSLPKGEISELVKSDYGYHIFLVEEHRLAQSMTPEEAAPAIRARLLRTKRERAYQEWLQKLGDRAALEINWPLL